LPQNFWRGRGPFRHYLRMIVHWQRSMAMCVLAERLHETRWRKRIRVHGTPPDELKEWGERPVIIACLHTGGFAFLRHWLRNRGIIAASLLRTRPRIIRRYEELRSRASARKGLPSFIPVDNMRAAIRFLTRGRVLIVAIEAQPESRSQSVVMGAPLRIGDGAARLARLTGATLLPASVWIRRGVDIRFRKPAPPEVAASTDTVNEFLARELWADLERDPCAIGWTTLEAYAPQNLLRPRTRWP
jgi:lauroyl/myristoyl acyltransferase